MTDDGKVECSRVVQLCMCKTEYRLTLALWTCAWKFSAIKPEPYSDVQFSRRRRDHTSNLKEKNLTKTYKSTNLFQKLITVMSILTGQAYRKKIL